MESKDNINRLEISKGKEVYDEIMKEAEVDDNIKGMILTGGRGKGFATENSDYDVFLVVADEKLDEYKEKYESRRIDQVIEVFVFSLSEFTRHATIGSGGEDDGYNFTHLKAQVDKGGIQELINEKGVLPKEKIKEIAEKQIDAYMNQYYRAIKNHRDGNLLASRMDGIESIQYLLAAIFAMNGRIRPYNKYLEWEIDNFPLANFAWSKEEFLETIKSMMDNGDIELQKKLFRQARDLFYSNGFKDSIDGWNGHWLGE